MHMKKMHMGSKKLIKGKPLNMFFSQRNAVSPIVLLLRLQKADQTISVDRTFQITIYFHVQQ